MLVMIGLLAGAYYGYSYAKKRGGNRLDKLQYSAVYGIAFGVLSVLLDMALGWIMPL